MQWWGSLTQQFQTIADTALKEARSRSPDLPGVKAASELAEQAGKAMVASADQAGQMINQALASGQPAAGQPAARSASRAPAAPRKTAPRKAPAAKASRRAR